MSEQTPETTADTADTQTQDAGPVRVPNVSPGARSGLDHEVIGSNAQEAYDANQDLGADPNPEADEDLTDETVTTETDDGAGQPDGQADPDETVTTEQDPDADPGNPQDTPQDAQNGTQEAPAVPSVPEDGQPPAEGHDTPQSETQVSPAQEDQSGGQ